MQSKAEDEGILAYVEDDNAAMRLPGRRTCLDICLVCYNYHSFYDITIGTRIFIFSAINSELAGIKPCIIRGDI